MGKTVRYLGLAVLAAAAWVLIASEAGWIAAENADPWFLPLAKTGGAVFVLGILCSAWSPVSRRLRQGRCVRCGAPTERGQSYCLDHLRATVHEAQDHLRESETRSGRYR